MAEFSAILAQLEASERHLDVPTGMRFAPIAVDGSATHTRASEAGKSRVDCAAAAYGQACSEWRSENGGASRGVIESTSFPDMKSLLEELHLARGSIEKLRSLRRKFAWTCHPDRRRSVSGSCADKLMAELNARIDAAIAELARRSGGTPSCRNGRGFRCRRR